MVSSTLRMPNKVQHLQMQPAHLLTSGSCREKNPGCKKFCLGHQHPSLMHDYSEMCPTEFKGTFFLMQRIVALW